jgi:hypothetical protein
MRVVVGYVTTRLESENFAFLHRWGALVVFGFGSVSRVHVYILYCVLDDCWYAPATWRLWNWAGRALLSLFYRGVRKRLSSTCCWLALSGRVMKRVNNITQVLIICLIDHTFMFELFS